MEIEYRTYIPCDLRGSAVVIGFPSLGLVSSIATNFLSRELKLDLIGGFTSPQFPPYCVLQGGEPMPQVRVFSAERKADPENPGIECGRLSIITSEFVPKPEQHYEIAMAILDWIVRNEIKTIITLDGIPMFAPDKYDLIGAGSNAATREYIKECQIEPFDDGMVRGISGVLLYEGSMRDLNVISLMGSAKSELPDPTGGAKLLEPVRTFFPELEFDTKPLYEEAEELNKRINPQPDEHRDPDDAVLYG